MNVQDNMSKVNLADLSQQALQQFFVDLGEPAYRATQFIKWLHQLGVSDFAEMTNFKKSLRTALNEKAEIKLPEIAYAQESTDGTIKWLVRLFDGQSIETVYIPDGDRATLCVSSQVGCALNCQFCSTARQGFSRNLSIAEIIGQVWLAVSQLSAKNSNRDRVISNVVMMGMGEPLLNYDNVKEAMALMLDDNAYNLSKYRVTLSTSGVVPQMSQLARDLPVSLAVSLHAPNNELRNKIVPINRKYPLEELIPACREFFKNEPKRLVTFEYVMLDGVNDDPKHAKQLINILQTCPAKVNLIPFNPFPNTIYRCSSEKAIEKFRQLLQKAGYNTITRKTRGDDIDAACGQLVGNITTKIRHLPKQYQHPLMMKINVKSEVGQQGET